MISNQSYSASVTLFVLEKISAQGHIQWVIWGHLLSFFSFQKSHAYNSMVISAIGCSSVTLTTIKSDTYLEKNGDSIEVVSEVFPLQTVSMSVLQQPTSTDHQQTCNIKRHIYQHGTVPKPKIQKSKCLWRQNTQVYVSNSAGWWSCVPLNLRHSLRLKCCLHTLYLMAYIYRCI